nr:hypothetical protein [Euryarchaeota archaeon]
MNPSETEVEGASLPQGIAVDEAAAYFGVTDSADIILHLNQTDPINGMGEFFSIAIDLVLQPEFGFEEAAQRLGCEGGEIYYLLTGPFGLVSLSDPLRLYLGGEDSEGNVGVHPGFPEHEMNALESLTDIFSLLKMFGLGHLIGGLPLLGHYVSQYAGLVASSAANKAVLLQLSQELNIAIEQAKTGSVTPISCLGAPTHVTQPAPAPVSAPAPVPAPPPQITPAPAPAPAPPAPTPVAVPQPAPQIAPTPAPAPVSVPAPTSPQPVDVVSQEPPEQPVTEPMVIVREPTVEIESNPPTEDQQVATSDAFASQFSAAADIDAPVAPIEPESVPAPQSTTAPSPPVVEQPQPVVEPQIAPPAPTEPVQQPPQAVTPKRAPIGSSVPSTPATGWPAAPSSPPDQSALNSVSDLVSGGPHAPRAPAQPIHHNIQSGKNCSRCGIGVEQSWQYCPLCNGNL